MNRLTLKRGLSITRCVLLVLCFRLAAILTWQRVLLLKAVAKDCERQRHVGTAALQLAALFNNGVKPHRLYIKIVLADPYRENCLLKVEEALRLIYSAR